MAIRITTRGVPAAVTQTALLVALLAGAMAPAHAYSYDTCDGSRLKWNANRTTMYISNVSFPVGSVWDNQLQYAMWHWNNVNSLFQFFVSRDTDTTYGKNGRNEVVLGRLDPGLLGLTRSYYHCTWTPFRGWEFGRDEADVIFNDGYVWTLSPFDFSAYPGEWSFEGTALHEFGHVLGLNHENRTQATMNSIHPSGGPVGHYQEWDPLPDDRRGARALYGGSSTSTDIATSAFKFGGSEADLVASQPRATPGSLVWLEYTFGNLGTTRQTFDIGFYLSENTFISTADTFIGTLHGAYADPGFIGTFFTHLNIPAWVPPGRYYLGFIVDPTNVVAEMNESNANQHMPRPIEIYVDPPTITPILDGPLGLNDWYTGNVTLTWRIESVQPLTSQQDCQAHSVRTNTTGVAYTCTAANVGGTSSQSVTIRRDATPPMVRAVAKPATNSAGWRKAPVTVTFTGSDATSGVAGCTAPAYFGSEGTGYSATGHCSNGAGLSSADTVADNIDIDLTAPSVQIAVPADRAVYALNSTVPVAYVCSDSLSGIASCTAPLVTGASLDTSVPRSGVTFTVRAVDAAGNVTRRTVRYSVQ